VFELRDQNGDGRADLLGAWSAGIAVMNGNADGSLGSSQGYGGGSGIAAIGDFDGDHRPDLVSLPGWNGLAIVLSLHFGRESTAPSIESIAPAGVSLVIGESRTIEWTATDNSAMGSVDLFLSRHGRRGPFERIAVDLPNTGSHPWIVTGPTSDSVAIKIVARDAADNVSWRVTDPLERIVEVVAGTTPMGPSEFAISRIEPNPARHRLRVAFALPTTGRVTLALHDLCGRRVALLSDASCAAGTSSIESELPSLEAGLYFLRLETGGRSATARVTLMR
jgi:hypothetical protein